MELRHPEHEILGKNEFLKIQNEVHDKFEEVRGKVWDLMMREDEIILDDV